jgi:hypothetical protein
LYEPIEQSENLVSKLLKDKLSRYTILKRTVVQYVITFFGIVRIVCPANFSSFFFYNMVGYYKKTAVIMLLIVISSDFLSEMGNLKIILRK